MTTDVQSAAAGGSLAQRPKVFGLFSMVLFSVSAILVADTVASSAAMGVQGLGFWMILGLLFFIPYGFVTAELGSAWPDEGGIYVWVKQAFGPGFGTVTSWMYWVNVALWAPSVFVLFIGAIEVAFNVNVPPFWEAVIVIAMVWAIVLVGILPLTWTKFVPSLSAALKVVVLVGLGVAGVAFAIKHGTANSFSVRQWLPAWNTDSLSFLPIIIYSYMGFELMSSAGGAIKEPRRDVPKMIVLAGVAILGVYMFATFGILASIHTKDVSIVTGIVDALKLSFRDVLNGHFGWLFDVVMVCLLFTFFGNMVTWSDRRQPDHRRHGPGRHGAGRVRPRQQALRYARLRVRAHGRHRHGHHHPGLRPGSPAGQRVLDAVRAVVHRVPHPLPADVPGAAGAAPPLPAAAASLPRARRHRAAPGCGRCSVRPASILTLFLFFYYPVAGTSKGAFWAITGGGTLISLVIGWWLYWHASHGAGAGAGVTPSIEES